MLLYFEIILSCDTLAFFNDNNYVIALSGVSGRFVTAGWGVGVLKSFFLNIGRALMSPQDYVAYLFAWESPDKDVCVCVCIVW